MQKSSFWKLTLPAVLLAAAVPLSARGGTERFTTSELTVKDRETGLLWARNGNLLRLEGRGQSAQRISRLMAKLNKQEYGGCSNWHVPSRQELETLADYALQHGYGGSTSDTGKTVAAFLSATGFIGIGSGLYFTSSRYREGESFWHLNMSNGSFTGNSSMNDSLLPVCFDGSDPGVIGKGKSVYQEYCSGCHSLKLPTSHACKMPKRERGGLGRKYGAIMNTIRNGTDSGMPRYREILSNDSIYAATYYILTIRCSQQSTD